MRDNRNNEYRNSVDNLMRMLGTKRITVWESDPGYWHIDTGTEHGWGRDPWEAADDILHKRSDVYRRVVLKEAT